MLHAAIRENLFCPIYTLMPDHVHLIWMGVSDASDQRLASRFLRTNLAPHIEPYCWQHQPYDHVLRTEERTKKAFTATCEYIAANPERAGLIEKSKAWPYIGCVVPGYPGLHPLAADFWDKYWRLYASARVQKLNGKLKAVGEESAI